MKTSDSNLFNQLVKAAESVKPKPKVNPFENMFKPEEPAKPTIAEIIRSMKKAQADPLAGAGGLPGEAPGLPGEDIGGLPGEGGGENEEAKTKIAEALVALCGGDVESCCEFIRSCCAPPEETGGMGEPGLEGPPPKPMSSMEGGLPSPSAVKPMY